MFIFVEYKIDNVVVEAYEFQLKSCGFIEEAYEFTT